MWARLAQQVGDILAGALADSAELISFKVRNAFIRLAVVSIGAGVMVIALFCLFASIFLTFAQINELAMPALYTGLIALGLGWVTLLVGINRET